MLRFGPRLLLAASSITVMAQPGAVSPLPPHTVLPIVFTSTVSAKNARPGDIVYAKTLQAVQLPDSTSIPAGTRVSGHVMAASAFVYDRTPYATQKNALLTVRFDTVEANGAAVPLQVTVRAMADVYATHASYEPESTDLDPLGTLTLVGGALLTPSQSEVRNRDNDVVAYQRKGGVYAHLIRNGRCDGSSTEVSMGIFSPSACGLYGYTNVTGAEFGSAANPSTLTLESRRTSPEIAKHSTALLEVVSSTQTSGAEPQGGM